MPPLRHECAPLPILFLLFTSVPHQGPKKRKNHGNNFPVPSSLLLRTLIWRAKINAPLRHKGAPLSTLCLLYYYVLRNGQKSTFRDKILRKSVLSLNKEGASFTLKITLFLLRKGHLLGVGILGEQAPRPLIPPPLTACAPSGATRKVNGDNWPVPPSLYIRALMWKAKCPIKA